MSVVSESRHNKFFWKWIEPVQQTAIPEPSGKGGHPVFGPSEPEGENLKRLRPAQYVRREFFAKGSVASAKAYATAHGLYRLFINGEQADERLLAPDVTPFDKLLTYQVYDITHLIKSGPNAAGAILTDGWHIGRIGLTGDSCQYADKLAFIMQIDICYNDGSTESITTDGSFRSSTGAIDFSDIFIGERYDARKEPAGWSEPGFDDSLWEPVTETTSSEELVEQLLPPVLKHERFEGRLIITPSGQKVYDIGQVIAGVECVTARGKRGAVLRLEHSETLDKDGNFIRNIAGRNKEQTDYYIFAGRPVETYEPVGTYHGFRYIMAVYNEEDIHIEKVEAYAIRTANTETSAFECSDNRLNRLWQNTLWSQRGNTISIPTDCPQRERSGFTGDMQIFIRAACINMDMRCFVRSWLRSLRMEQGESGEVPIIVPNFPGIERMQRAMSGTNCSSGWGDAVVIVPWELYRAYGDVEDLRENYDAMKKWLGFVTRWAESGMPNAVGTEPKREGHRKRLWDTGFHFGDWLVPSKTDGMSNPFATAELTKGPIGTAYFANSATLLSEIAAILGETADSGYYGQLANEIRDAYVKEYYLGDGKIKGDLQGIYVTALAFGMLPQSERRLAAKRLAELIKENDYRLDTGFLSVSHIMDVLSDNGYHEIALKLLYQTKCPSWLYEVERGATTIWESWSAILPDGTVTSSSFNHYAFGCVIDWMIRRLAGIRTVKPGYAEITIEPDLACGLEYVKAHYDSVRGRIAVYWRKSGGGAEIDLEIPQGVRAQLVLPNGTRLDLPPGKQTYKV
jgi:alpha-L-rhamnosidase